MKRNVGRGDRVIRGMAALVMASCMFVAPFPLVARLGIFGVMSVYLLFTAIAGTCAGYLVLGTSTCATGARPAAER